MRDSGWSVTIAELSRPWPYAKDDGYQYTAKEAAANARLIAAAPEMFALLVQLSDRIPTVLWHTYKLTMSKATGEK